MKKKYILLTIIILILLTIISWFFLFNVKVKSIEKLEVSKESIVLKVTLKNYLFKKVYCSISDKKNTKELKWVKAENGICILNSNYERNNIFIKSNKKVNNTLYVINEILDLSLKKEKIYLAMGNKYKLVSKLHYIGEVDESLIWESDNTEIATVKEGIVSGIKPGEVNITATSKNGIKATTKVIVTDLIVKPTINSKKEYLPCRRYSVEEAKLLDSILEDRINEVGYQTRSGPIAAARFLLLEFPYQLRYFNENGRLNNHSGQSYVDGEGRYYKKGLYLHEDKFADIISSRFGPAIWGCPLWDYTLKTYRPNGFTCSGFVSWVLLNGGFDVKDSGAGDFSYRDDDLSDLGKKEPITKELMASGRVKVGDLIGRDGHMAIIIGLDETNIYIAEALPINVRVVTLTKMDGLQRSTNFDFIIPMDEVYNYQQGNYTEMWE